MIEPKLRELRATDLRCHANGCGAGPGERCRRYGLPCRPHAARIRERDELAAAGWMWREVDPTDKGLS